MIPYGKHYLNEDDINAVVDVLRNGALTQGPKVAEFEQAISKYTGSKYAVAVSSGTAALHLACMAADISIGDELLTTPNTFVASANCAFYVGATPIFADIDPLTLNLDIAELQAKCKQSPKLKAVIPVHFAGLPCDMRRIKSIATEFNLKLIEDASHALGATYEDGSRVGNCKYSDMTVFSFHPVKGITSGEGGMITTNDETLVRRLLKLRSHGISKGNFEFSGIGVLDNQLEKPEAAAEDGELRMWYYEMQELGFNYRITDIQSALAISQIKKIDRFIERRRALVSTYDRAFQALEMIQPTQLAGRRQSSHHIYVIRIDFNQLGISRHKLMKQLADHGIGTQVHYIPVPLQPFYESRGYRITDYPHTDEYYQTALSIPLFYGLSDEDQNRAIDSLTEILE
jgi:perosamine synthetase